MNSNTTSSIHAITHCKYRLPCGWCDRRNQLCTQDSGYTVLNTIPKIEYNNTYIPEACRTCSSHPSNGGTGLCACSKAYPELGEATIQGSISNSVAEVDSIYDYNVCSLENSENSNS